jgi:hypothetical protein
MLGKSSTLLLAALLVSCSKHGQVPSGRGPHQETPPPARRNPVVADQDENIWADPRRRTLARLGVLQNVLLAAITQTGRAPRTIESAVGPGEVPGMDLSVDGWGRPWSYLPGSDNYMLRSVGLDGKLHTADDIAIDRYTDVRLLEEVRT